MHSFTTALTAALLSTAASAAPASNPLQSRSVNETAGNLDIISQLILAPTAVDRIALLADDPTNFVYDFTAPPENATTKGDGGHTVKADRKTFPALIGTGVSMTVGFIGPCGFNTPHIHPRSSEINIIVQGRLGTEFAAENGAPPISNTLNQYQMTVFPAGATHTEFNPDCEDAVFVAGFASEDPGVEQIAQTLFELDPELVKADLGVQTLSGQDIETFAKHLPKNVALGVEQCLKKCGIQKNSSYKKA
ncbi:RmlC-like cupin [Polychaeton citri CBS 116435]|uniref:RmlC-like cupin n=1 Tax=Polychaeton citri CBS 116435 TaxID=1314669 RepID=A0A9P4Q4I8_9PEZI|nr:RmlC-like cupin [Polychaeton citri CBS 116435]